MDSLCGPRGATGGAETFRSHADQNGAHFAPNHEVIFVSGAEMRPTDVLT